MRKLLLYYIIVVFLHDHTQGQIIVSNYFCLEFLLLKLLNVLSLGISLVSRLRR